MATAYVADIQQSGPRGGDKLYAPDWLMASAQRRAGMNGTFEAVLMLSLDPATITDRRYPLLFQTGETAYGLPIVDGQHPHNFVMEIGAHYTYQFSGDTFLDFYAAPVGDPALGPEAYPHRASAMELPQAALSHHLQDSTHIADDVVTHGLASPAGKAQALKPAVSMVREPGENRWIIQQRRHRFVVRARVGFPCVELGRAGFHRAPRASGSGLGSGRSAAHHRVSSLHPPPSFQRAWVRVVVQLHLGTDT